MSIDELLRVVPVPANPIEAGSVDQWQAIQSKHEIELPEDLCDIGIHYGSGTFTPAIRIFNPFSADFIQTIKSQSDMLRDYKKSEGDDAVPYDVYPESPGLLPIGADDLGNCLYWLTEGQRNSWPVLVDFRDKAPPSFLRFDMPLTSFLAGICSGELEVPMVDRGMQFEFTPSNETSITQHEYTSLYNLYHLNDNRAEFWVKHAAWELGNYVAIVKSIGGATFGPLSDVSSMPNVIADCYQDGRKVAENERLRTPDSNAYRRIPKPFGIQLEPDVQFEKERKWWQFWK